MKNGSYDYDKAMEEMGSGSEVYNAVKDYQDKLVALIQSVKKCEEGFHGKADGSFHKAYEKMYKTLGHYSDVYSGTWTCFQIASLRKYLDRLYFTAEYDKAQDQESKSLSNLI